MSLASNTPIIVGIADVKQAIPEDLTEAKSPVELAADVSKLALLDAGISPASLSAIIVVRASTDSVPMVSAPFGTSENPPASVAKRIGAKPAIMVHSASGGNTPQQLVNEWTEKLAQGFSGCVLLTGAEVLASIKQARKANIKLDWNESHDVSCEDHGPGITGMIAVDDMRHGMSKPTTQYAIAENSRRAKLGLDYDEYAFSMGSLLAPFSKVAEKNEFAAFREPFSVSDIATVSESNRYVDFPYTFRMIAKDSVNQAAAVVLTTVGAAKKIGIDQGKWVFLHAYAQAQDLPILQRENLGESKALTLTYKKALRDSGLGIDDISFIDLYSCFPIVVELAKEALGIDDSRALTQTGGLPFFGGPGNNYSMHAITAVVRQLRKNPDRYGLVGANGGMINKHAVGIYSCVPGWQVCDSRALQYSALQQQSPIVERVPNGEAIVESYTVSHSKGRPVNAVVIGRLKHGGARFVSCNIPQDSEFLERLLTQDCIGQEIFVYASPRANFVTFNEGSITAISKKAETKFREQYQYCSVVVNDRVLEVFIDRPESYNSLHPPANDELAHVFDVYMHRSDLRVAILTGRGNKAFCSGNDLKYSASGKPYWVPHSGFAGITSRLGRNKPIIAAVNGVALGGGFEVALASDIIIASEDAEFALPEVKRGMIAAAGGVVRLPRQIPEKLAMELLLTGRSISAARALELGVINHVEETKNVMTKARSVAAEIAANSPTSIRLTMELSTQMANQGDANIAASGMPEVLDQLICSEDFYEGPRAFAEKRAPVWTGR